MRRLLTALALTTAVAGVTASSSAATLDEVLQKHIAARGGREAWAAIETMKVTGSFTAFSKVAPFTLYRARDDRYRFDHTMNGKVVIIGHDGNEAWWINEFFQPGAQSLGPVDLAAQQAEFHFVNSLFDYASHGYTAKLLGDVEFEGEPAIGIELTRSEGVAETWYLDPATYLEIARRSPGSDFGEAAEQRTVFDDFREVAGVKIPYFVESQWYTRDRIMQIESVEVNVGVDDELFRQPAPPGMGVLRPLIGEWTVAVRERQQPGAEWQESTRTSTVIKRLNGALLEETFSTQEGPEVIRTVSYDSFRKRYRLTEMSRSVGLLDVMAGTMGADDGRLVVDNLESGTTLEMFGMVIHGRTTLSAITDGGFKVEQEASTDAGENWFVAVEATYSRKPAEAAVAPN